VDTQGDAFFVAFARASDALIAARDGQARLAEGPIRVRMGLHTGEPIVTEEGYVGIDVHRAARIAAAGHGGQVLVSQATRDLVADEELRDLGEHRLKDLSAPERIYQLGEEEFPRLKTLFQTNLPIPATPFLGREAEVSEVQTRLAVDDVRLLTLTGAGGSGKTRLALQAAGSVADAYPHGVWWVPLAAVTDPAGVLTATARALGGGASPTEVIGDRRLLLLLDNFEHVIDAASELPPLLATCPRLDVLVTSRERLRVQGEHAYPVPVLARAEARALFVERARATNSDFSGDGHVDDLCARLDDLPLAIELAAARTSLLSTEQLLERLGTRLDLLRGGRDAEARQRTLRATIEWSYELLEPEEQRLVASLSVFRGGWTLEAAERICDADLELLESLVDKSLVRRWESGRFGMLETIREFAGERLEPERRDELLPRLLDHLFDTFEEAKLRPETPGEPRMDVAQAERANVDVVLEWARASGAAEAGLRLMWMLEMYWGTNDPLGGRERLDALLAVAGEEIDPLTFARAFRLRGATYDMSGEHALAEREYERAIDLFRSLGIEDQAAHLVLRVASSANQLADHERAARLAAEGLEAARRRGNRRDEAIALNILGAVAFERGDREEGIRLEHESAAVAEEIGFAWFHGVTLLGVAEQLIGANAPGAATRDLCEGLEILASVRDHVNLPIALAAGAAIAAARGDAVLAGTLWGAVEALAEIEPKKTTDDGLRVYSQFVEGAHGADFERGRARGRTLSLEEAVEHALSNLD
jgi:predicted ATPase